MLVLISGEFGFLGVMPMPYSKITYEFKRFEQGIGNKIRNKDYSDEHCNFCYQLQSGEMYCPSFTVDYQRDIPYLTEISKMNNIIVAMSGEIDELTINMIVENIFVAFGRIMNSDDEYFEVLMELWKSIDKNHVSYNIIVNDKFERLRGLLRLSEARIGELVAL